MRNLTLTSPTLMHGTDVTQLQTLLKKNGWYDGAIDAQYGVHTAQGVHRAKYWLGYPLGDCDNVAGDMLFSYLLGNKKPTPAMKLRVANRKRKQSEVPLGVKLVTRALTQLGQTENPHGSNRSFFSNWYNVIGPWCAMFVTWCGDGLAKFALRGKRYAYVPYIDNDAHAGVNGLVLAAGPATGIVCCFDWNNDHVADHVGFAISKEDLKRLAPQAYTHAINQFGNLGADEFWTVEGNTGVGNDSNGGEVMIRKRHRSQVKTFARATA